ncbi:hypothetical protein [Synechocystis sp. PCC 7509]|uniref:hypothetical protein n=1 Tax=Synechocystis sp. PCC 7509 TaxID=927677 RepID=UPI0002AC17D4|nr:hypothetical protein [Synechocystis sp. PCC 7509]
MKTAKKASGWLERKTTTKKLTNGSNVTYPIVQGDRIADNPQHWYWVYRWEEKTGDAYSDNGYITRAIAIPQTKVEGVRLALSLGWSVEKITLLIRATSHCLKRDRPVPAPYS